MSYPRYVPHSTGDGKWTDADINAVTAHVLAGATADGSFAYPASYVIRVITGVYDAVNAAGQVVYGGTTDEGGVDGDDASAVIQAALETKGMIFLKNGTYTINTSIALRDGCRLTGETREGVILQASASLSTAVVENDLDATHGPLTGAILENLTVDVNDVADVIPVIVHTPRKCHFRNLSIMNCQSEYGFLVDAYAAVGDGGITAGDLAADGGILNCYGSTWNEIHFLKVGGLFRLEASDILTTGVSQITLCSFENLWGYSVYNQGISFGPFVSGTRWRNVWIALQNDARYGVVFHDTDTPLSNEGVYDNSFETLWVDAWGDAATSVDTKIVYFKGLCKGCTVRNLFAPSSTTAYPFGGYAVYAIDAVVSYYVEHVNPGDGIDPAEGDLYMKVYSRGYRLGPTTTDSIAMLGEVGDTELYFAMNSGYRAGVTPYIKLRTLTDGVEYDSTIMAYEPDANLYFQPAKSLVFKVPDSEQIVVTDADNNHLIEVDDDGNIGCIKDTAGFILKDRNTGAFYRLKVSGGGTLGVEAV